MTVRSYLWSVRLLTLIALGAWLIVVFSIDPESSGIIGQFLFYITFFVALVGIYILFFTWLWRRTTRENFSLGEVSMGFRQGALLALLTTILIFFQQMSILVWWDALLVTAGILLIELYFLSSQTS